jgi:ABC-type multidrug transport system ATPase subunit
VVIVSSELDEIYALSDRIAVMYEGKIVGFSSPDIAEHELGLLMAGAVAGAAGAGAAGQPTDNAAPQQLDADEILELPAAEPAAGTRAEDPAGE